MLGAHGSSVLTEIYLEIGTFWGILDTNNLDDFLLKCAIDQSLSTQEASGYDAVESIKENPPKCLEEAFEQTLNGFPKEQFTLIEITRKDIVTRTFECIEDEDLKARVSVKFIGEDAIDSGGVTREFFCRNFFAGLLYIVCWSGALIFISPYDTT